MPFSRDANFQDPFQNNRKLGLIRITVMTRRGTYWFGNYIIAVLYLNNYHKSNYVILTIITLATITTT